MVNILEQAKECTDVRKSEGKNRFLGNLNEGHGARSPSGERPASISVLR